MTITLSTSKKKIGSNSDDGFEAELYGWYSNQSGNTAVVHVELRVTFIDSDYASYYGTNKEWSLTFDGTNSAQYPDVMVLDDTITMKEQSKTMTGGSSISASGSWYSYNYGSFSVGLSDTVVLPQFIIAPTKPTISVTNNNGHQNTIQFGTTSFGYPSTGNIKLYVDTDPTFAAETLLATETTVGTKTFVHTGLTARTTYYYRTIATNGSASSAYVSTQIETRPALYAPDDNEESAIVQELYVSHNGLSKKVIKLYRGNSDDEAERIY